MSSLRLGEWKLLSRRRGEGEAHWLFNLADDPTEQHDLLSQESELWRQLLTLREGWIDGLAATLTPGFRPTAIELDADLTRQLRALGYIR
jgi:hypothetical protein